MKGWKLAISLPVAPRQRSIKAVIGPASAAVVSSMGAVYGIPEAALQLSAQ
jgi:hypothetical protein